MIRISLFIITFFLISLFSCKKNKGEEAEKEDFNRNALLTNIADNVILPRYNELYTSANTLNVLINNLNQPVTTSEIDTIRVYYKKAYINWQACSAFEFGPAANHILKASLNTYPTDSVIINDNILNGNYNLGTASNIVAIGFPALDYLLFKNSDVQLTVNYFNDAFLGVKRLSYLKDVSQYGFTTIHTVNQDWVNNYSTTFKNANGTDVGSSVSLLINSLNKDFETFIRDGKVGIPLGIRSLGNPLPEKVEGYYSKTSIELLEKSLADLQNLINGNGSLTGSLGFDDYLNHLEAKHGSEDLSTKINNQFTVINQKLSFINQSMDVAVVNNQAKVQDLYTELQKMIVLLKVDLSSALSILITYQDNDGD